MNNEIEVCPHCTNVFEQSAPTWTDVTPTEPGYYWIKNAVSYPDGEVVKLSYPPNDPTLSIEQKGDEYRFLYITFHYPNAQWYGPLRMPVDE